MLSILVLLPCHIYKNYNYIETSMSHRKVGMLFNKRTKVNILFGNIILLFFVPACYVKKCILVLE